MKTGYFKTLTTTILLTPALLIGTLPAAAQSYGRDNGYNQRTQQQFQNRDYDRRDYDRRDNDRFRENRGWNNDRRDYRDYDRHETYRPGYVAYAPAYPAQYGYYNRDNGIGAGKGAAIGAVGGAVLGAILGGGKGAVIGGVVGAAGGYILGNERDRKKGRN